MQIIKSMIIAFSMYSKIPMPQFEWKDEDMKYVLCFFPWVGVVIGGLVYLWKMICDRFEIGILCYTLVGTALPLLITGGFHVDGRVSFLSAERKETGDFKGFPYWSLCSHYVGNVWIHLCRSFFRN